MAESDNNSLPPDSMISRGRSISFGIVLVFVAIEAVALTVRQSESDIVRVLVAMGLLYAAWLGQQWAIALVAIGCPLAALYSFVFGLFNGGIFLIFVKSESLNTFFRHQAAVAATQPPNDLD